MESLSKQIINKTILSENDFGIIVNEIIDIFNRFDNDSLKEEVLKYLNNHNITLQEIYNLLINNQNNSNAIVILGEFNCFGIGTNVDKKKAFELWEKAANLENPMGLNDLGFCYSHGIGTDVDLVK